VPPGQVIDNIIEIGSLARAPKVVDRGQAGRESIGHGESLPKQSRLQATGKSTITRACDAGSYIVTRPHYGGHCKGGESAASVLGANFTPSRHTIG
jgi:hypothetical protein